MPAGGLPAGVRRAASTAAVRAVAAAAAKAWVKPVAPAPVRLAAARVDAVATPSAPPSSWLVLTMPEARPAWWWSVWASAVVVAATIVAPRPVAATAMPATRAGTPVPKAASAAPAAVTARPAVATGRAPARGRVWLLAWAPTMVPIATGRKIGRAHV